MSTWDGNNFYYSGQGVVLIGERDAAGNPKNLVPVGNVSALSIAIATSVLEHKESQTGSRGIDLRLTTETNCNLTMTMENFISANLDIALRGSTTKEVAGTVTGEVLNHPIPGAVLPLDKINVAAVVIDNPAGTPLVLYTNDSTPWDYKLNANSGSIQLNDGVAQLMSAMATGGTPLTAVSAATQAVVTVNNVTLGASAGDYVTFTLVTGTDAADLNGKWFRVVSATTTTVTIDYNSTAKTFTYTTAVMTSSHKTLSADYTYTAQNLVDALTEGATERYLRFEGLNTADGNNPVVVEVFKFSTDPLQQLALIGDEVQQFELAGNVLADPLQTSGSKFFKQRMVR